MQHRLHGIKIQQAGNPPLVAQLEKIVEQSRLLLLDQARQFNSCIDIRQGIMRPWWGIPFAQPVAKRKLGVPSAWPGPL